MTRFLIFGILGLAGSVVATAARDSVASRRLELNGGASVALFPIYGLIAIIYPMVAIHVGGFPWYGRGVAYMIAFFAAQLAIGFVLQKINFCPWNYSDKGSVAGLIRVADAPVWFLAGLAVEWIYPYVKAAATMIR